MDRLVEIWYQQPVPYVALLAFLLAALLTLWVFYSASRRGVGAPLWKILALLGTIIVLPSLLLGVLPDLALQNLNLLQPLALVGIAGVVLAAIATLGFLAAPGQAAGGGTQVMEEVQMSFEQPPAPTAPIEAPPIPGMGTQQAPAPVSAQTVIQRTKPQALAWLVVRTGPLSGKDFRLGELNKIGRDAQQCEIVIDDPAVSRQHASIRLSEGEFFVTDLDSANGTFVNNEQISRHKLSNGDVIKMGDTTFAFMRLEEKKPA